MDGDGRHNCSLGRHATKETAPWFNNKFTVAQTSFNHEAGRLYFAFIGTLRLSIADSTLCEGEESFTFKDIGLAPAHAGASATGASPGSATPRRASALNVRGRPARLLH